MKIDVKQILRIVRDFFTGAETRLVPRTVRHYAKFVQNDDNKRLPPNILEDRGFFVVEVRHLSSAKEKKIVRMMRDSGVRYTDFFVETHYQYVAFTTDDDAARFKLALGAVDDSEN